MKRKRNLNLLEREDKKLEGMLKEVKEVEEELEISPEWEFDLEPNFDIDENWDADTTDKRDCEEDEVDEDFDDEETEAEMEVEAAEDDGEEALEEIDLEEFQGTQSSVKSRVSTGLVTIVNSKKCGKRVELLEKILTGLNNPAKVEIAFNDKEIAIGEDLNKSGTKFNLKKSGKKAIIYSANLVTNLTKSFNLDYSNRTSITFTEGRYGIVAGKPVAIIKIK